MSRPAHVIALGRAADRGCPYVYRQGARVVLVFSARVDALRSRVTGDVVARDCTSVALAREVERRVLSDLRAFPERARTILKVSEGFATAARRNALRRKGQLHR